MDFLPRYLDQWVQIFELYGTSYFNNSIKWLKTSMEVEVKIFEFLEAFGAKPSIKDDDKKTG